MAAVGILVGGAVAFLPIPPKKFEKTALPNRQIWKAISLSKLRMGFLNAKPAHAGPLHRKFKI